MLIQLPLELKSCFRINLRKNNVDRKYAPCEISTGYRGFDKSYSGININLKTEHILVKGSKRRKIYIPGC